MESKCGSAGNISEAQEWETNGDGVGLRIILSLMTYVQSNGFDIFLLNGVHDYTGVFGPRFMVAMLHIYIYCYNQPGGLLSLVI